MECFIRPWIKAVPEGVRLFIKATPKARRTSVGPIEETANGFRLKVSLSAPPDKGRANTALCKVIGVELGVAKSRVSVVSGASSRLKEILVLGESYELLAKAYARFGME